MQKLDELVEINTYHYLIYFFQENFTCDFNGDCEVNMTNRHICSYCRLAKCFAIGMQTQLIRCSSSKKNTKKQKKKLMIESITTTSNTLDRRNQSHQVSVMTHTLSPQDKAYKIKCMYFSKKNIYPKINKKKTKEYIYPPLPTHPLSHVPRASKTWREAGKKRRI
jgi:hypothetical protein